MKNSLRRCFLCVGILLFISSCGQRDESSFQRQGEELKKELIDELSSFNSLKDVFEKQEKLSNLFLEIAQLSQDAEHFHKNYKKPWPESKESLDSSQRLENAMRRVLAIPGARGILEKCQMKALEILVNDKRDMIPSEGK
jgi:hypothetical protein